MLERLEIIIKHYTLPALVFVLLSIVFTWPLAAHLNDAYPATVLPSGGDTNMYVWNIDLAARWLSDRLPVQHAGQMVFYPGGIDVLAGFEGVATFFLGAALVLIGLSPLAALNLIVLLGLITSALAAFLLVRHLTQSAPAAYFAGIAYGFDPFFLIRSTQHQHLVLGFVLPLAVYATLAFFHRPSVARAGGLAGCALISALVSWYYLLGVLIFYVLAALVYRRIVRLYLIEFFVAAWLTMAACLLVAMPILTHNANRKGLSDDATYTASLGSQPLNMIVPHPFTNLGIFSRPVYEAFPSSYVSGPNYGEASSYLGLPLLGLLIYAFVGAADVDRHRRLWVVTIAVFTVLSLGSYLVVANASIPLPYALVQHVFPFTFFRSVNRLFIFVILAAVLVAAYGVARLASKENRRSGWMWLSLACVLILGERVMLPYPMYSKPVPAFYAQIASDGGRYAIADVPEAFTGFSEYNFFQTVHGKPIVTGEFFYPAYRPGTFSFIRGNQLLSGSLCPSSVSVPDGAMRAVALADLRTHGVRYVVVHNFTLQLEPDCAAARSFIRRFFAGALPAYADGEITVYDIST